MKELYTPKIMSLAAHIPHIGQLAGAQGQGSAKSKLCGSCINVWLNVKEGRVCDYSQQVKACLVGQASASIVGHNITGSSRDELAQLRETVRIMLEEEGEPPEGKWSDFAVLLPVRQYKSRYSTVLIVFDAALEAMDMALLTKETASD